MNFTFDPNIQIDKYQMLKEVGSGTYGKIYLVKINNSENNLICKSTSNNIDKSI